MAEDPVPRYEPFADRIVREAIERGLEGDVIVLLTLGPDGSLADASVATGSGHAVLDNAAIRAAYAMGQLSGVSGRELILPVIFRLQ